MKKLITVSAMALLAVSAFGQGQVNFNNLDSGNSIRFIFRDAAGNPIAGDAGRAALLGGPSAGAVAYSISPVVTGNLTMLAHPTQGTTWVNFRTGAPAGYVNVGSAGARVLPNVPYSGDAALQIAVWTGGWNDWTSAWNAWNQGNSSTSIALSPMWTVKTTTGPLDAGYAVNTGLANLPGSTLVAPVPEPSTMALAGLAGAALLIFRRRK